VIQVMEGRHCFAHLTIEENLLTGAYTRTDGKAAKWRRRWRRSTPTSRA
jgi:ABC-type branched-subunit amino acid transport system ATPase component